jgi:hypothetical protein
MDFACEGGASIGDLSCHAHSVARVRDNKKAIRGFAVHNKVVNHATVNLTDHGVFCATNLDPAHPTHEGKVERIGRPLAHHGDLSHMAQVKEANGTSNGVVLGDIGRVTNRHIPAGELRHGRTVGEMPRF